jgi:hypothetical protein
MRREETVKSLGPGQQTGFGRSGGMGLVWGALPFDSESGDLRSGEIY